MTRSSGIVAGSLFALLMALAGNDGYHRDELYYLVAGRHLAWGYDDQPAFAPLLARITGENLYLLRLPSAIAAAATVLLVAAIARQMGGDKRAQLIAALVTAVAPLVVFAFHILSTTAFDLFFSALLAWILVCWLRSGQDRLLIAFGVVTGVALNNKALIAFLVLAFIAGFPRLLRRPAFWAGGVIALAMWTPYLLWQFHNGWPQLAMSEAIRADEPGGGRILMIPMQFVLWGLATAPIWLAGLWRLFKTEFRGFGVAYLVLLTIFMATGGQIYYPAGGYPVLIAAGAIVAANWRPVLVITAIAFTGLSAIAVGLPIYPVQSIASMPHLQANPDTLETIGWPELVATVRAVYREHPDTALIFTSNYGEAGAIVRFGHDLPPVYSGHNAFWRWGPPPDSLIGPVIVVGDFNEARLRERCGDLTLARRFDNGFGVDNDEQDTPIWVCSKPVRPWSQVWPELRHLG